MDEEIKLKKALLKKALGYNADEVVCEYVLDEDGQAKLSKKKVTRKHYAPDISAVKVLLEQYHGDYASEVLNMTDEELEIEKKRLLNLLKEEDSGDN